MNLPNKLTVARVLLIPFVLAPLLISERDSAPGWMAIKWLTALLFFSVAAVTDLLDGIIARRYNLITNWGKLMDSLADKLLVVSCFVAFVEKNYLPAWIVIAILLREFIITGLRSLGVEKGIVIQADRWGKSKTVTHIVTIIATMVLVMVQYYVKWLEKWDWVVKWGGPLEVYISYLIYGLGVVCVILSVGSGALYVMRNWSLVRED